MSKKDKWSPEYRAGYQAGRNAKIKALHRRSVETLDLSRHGDDAIIPKILNLIDEGDLTRQPYRNNVAKRIIWEVRRQKS